MHVALESLSMLGWNDELDEAFQEFLERGQPGRVATEHRSSFVLFTPEGEVRAGISGKLRHDIELGEAHPPAVGDWVAFVPDPESPIIIGVLPRRTKFSRKAAGFETREQIVAANVDVVFVVGGLDGDLNVRRIERYLTSAWESGARPVVVLTKADACDAVGESVARVSEIAVAVPVVAVSAHTGEGLDELRSQMKPSETIALLGSSGVGKSTLVNALVGSDLQEVRELRADGRGRHTTTTRDLIRLPNGALIIDTPGMRELQLWDGDDGVDKSFGDIAELAAACRFTDCRHDGEPGCAVAAAIDAGTLDVGRLASYEKLQRELLFIHRKQNQRAAADERRKIRRMARSRKGHKGDRDY